MGIARNANMLLQVAPVVLGKVRRAPARPRRPATPASRLGRSALQSTASIAPDPPPEQIVDEVCVLNTSGRRAEQADYLMLLQARPRAAVAAPSRRRALQHCAFCLSAPVPQ
jgi:hypothetical protein